MLFRSEEDEGHMNLPLDFTEPVDAVLLVSVFSSGYTKAITDLGLTVVTLDCAVEALGEVHNFDTIICEGKNSIRQLTESLIEQGITKIGFIGDVTYCESVKQKWIYIFFRRFFNQQFKRSCLPDGPKVGTISISPRGDWRMPSDASSTAWLQEIENIQA